MKLFKNQKGFNDTIVVAILGGIIGSIFIVGVFVWREIEIAKNFDSLYSDLSKMVSLSKEPNVDTTTENKEEKAIEDGIKKDVSINLKDLKHLGYGYYTNGEDIYLLEMKLKPGVSIGPGGIFEDFYSFDYFDESNRHLFVEQELYKMEGVDLDSFSTIYQTCPYGNCMGVAKDKNYLYFGTSPHRTSDVVDLATFEHLEHRFFRDKNYLYYDSNFGFGPYKYIDVNTFEILSDNYVKDKNNVYSFISEPPGEIIKGVDPDTFKLP